MGVMRRSVSNTAVEYTGTQDKEKVSYCQKCLEVKVLSPLKHRIYLDDNGKINPNPPPDSKNWKQCWNCGDIVGVYEAKQEADIMTLTEPHDNPFKFGRNNIETNESRKFDRTCKTQAKKQFKRDSEHYKEEDIKEALRKGARLISYVETPRE
jgi:hypothetical protein